MISTVDLMKNLLCQVTFGINIYLRHMSLKMVKTKQNVVLDVNYLVVIVIFSLLHQANVILGDILIGVQELYRILMLLKHITNQVAKLIPFVEKSLHKEMLNFRLGSPTHI